MRILQIKETGEVTVHITYSSPDDLYTKLSWRAQFDPELKDQWVVVSNLNFMYDLSTSPRPASPGEIVECLLFP